MQDNRALSLRPQTVVSLIDMIHDKQLTSDALHEAIYQQELELHHKRSVVQSSIRCPLSHEVQQKLCHALAASIC